MVPLTRRSAKIFKRLIAGLCWQGEAGERSRKVDNAPGAYMAVSVEACWPNLFSVTHYGEQNGDLMADPDMVFWLSPEDGKVYPVSFRNDYAGHSNEAMTFGQDGKIESWDAAQMRDMREFADMWMRNIANQQEV